MKLYITLMARVSLCLRGHGKACIYSALLGSRVMAGLL